jgi:hypothetical protein
VGFAGINSNSENTYAEDSFSGMVSRMEKYWMQHQVGREGCPLDAA